MKADAKDTGLTFSRRDLLRWLYMSRVTLASGVFAAALVVWRGAQPEQTFIATVMFMAAVGVTAVSFWFTHILNREPGHNFLYSQVGFDALLVTSIIHITGGAQSDFAPVYILVISSGALLLPLRGGVLLGGLVSILYLADIVVGQGAPFTTGLGLQIGLFALVALVTGWLGDRLRRAGIALGAVESELRQLRLDTGDILDSVSTGVLTVDSGERLVYMNAAAEVLLGIDGRQWIGTRVLDVVEGVAPGMGSLLRRSLDRKVPLVRYKTVAQRDGRATVLGVSTTVLDREDSDSPSITAIFQDITDQEKVDALNRRNERLEAVAELSASLAHEIKNPLSSIRSAVEQIGRPSLEEADRALLQRLVVDESERLSRLLSEFIEYSRVRLGHVEQVDLARLVRECVALVRRHPEAEECVEILEEGLDEARLIPGDGDLLHRVVFNLVLNAVQFSGESGQVRVGLRDRSRSDDALGLEIPKPVRLCVEDDGPGIAEEDLGRIFDPFFTKREGGSGLGLAMVHRAVEAHRGAVFVDSEAGEGTRFIIFLPGEAPATQGEDE